MTAYADDYNGEDIGGQMYHNDMLVENGFDNEYELIQYKYASRNSDRQFLPSITGKELVIIAQWMVRFNHSDNRYRATATRIVTDMTDGRTHSLSKGQIRCLMAFVRPHLHYLPMG